MSEKNIREGAVCFESTAEIVAAYISRNPVSVADLSRLIAEVHAALSNTLVGISPPVVAEKQKPAVSVRKSIHDEHLTCLECGITYKSMKRHLMAYHAISPDAYREKWGLPSDYPMVAPAYAEARSILAKEMGLGQRKKPGGKPRKAAA